MGKGSRVSKLGARQARGIGDDRQHIFPQCLMSSPGEVGGIHAAGIGDKKASPLPQLDLQECALRLKVFSRGQHEHMLTGPRVCMAE